MTVSGLQYKIKMMDISWDDDSECLNSAWEEGYRYKKELAGIQKWHNMNWTAKSQKSP